MSKLEQLTPNAVLRGILPDGLVNYNALVQSWPEISRLARAEAAPAEPSQAALL